MVKIFQLGVGYQGFLNQFIKGKEKSTYSLEEYLVSFFDNETFFGNGLIFNECGLAIVPSEVWQSFYHESRNEPTAYFQNYFEPEDTQHIHTCPDSSLSLIRLNTNMHPRNFGIRLFKEQLTGEEIFKISSKKSIVHSKNMSGTTSNSDITAIEFNTKNFPHGSTISFRNELVGIGKRDRRGHLYTIGSYGVLQLVESYNREPKQEEESFL